MSIAWMLVGTTVVTGFMAAHGQQPSATGRKIEFSDPGGSSVSSNLNAILNQKDRAQSPEEAHKRSLELFSPGNSLQGIGAPPPQRPASAANSKRLKELLEKRQEWIFLTPEDYHAESTIEEIFGIPEFGPNGESKERKSPLERYYERLDSANTMPTNRTRNDGHFGMGFGPGKQNDGSSKVLNLPGVGNEPGSIPELDNDNPLKQLLRGNSGNPLSPDKTKPTGFPDVLGRIGQWNPESPDALRAQAAHLEEFKRILDFRTPTSLPSSSPVSSIEPFDPLKPLPSTTPAVALPRNPDPVAVAPILPVRDSFSPFPTAVGTVGRPFELPSASTSLPGLTPAPATPEPTRTVVPASDFNIPKRRF